MNHVYNVKLHKIHRKLVLYRGVHAITLIILTASADGLVKRKIHAHYVKKLGQQLKQQKSDLL